MAKLRERIQRLEERRQRRELPPLVIKAGITAEEARQIEHDWIREHGRPGPLIITTRRESGQ
ncbi:MAG TPA: hypothetical protein VGX03_17995 [Candidatus Binatia bacterium]|jgi:hypothetical protein|nr:hypothetical protein [Candidatus Binatia bacterium]